MLNTSQSAPSYTGAVQTPRELRCLLLDDSTFDRARIRRLSQSLDIVVKLDEVESISELDQAVRCTYYDIVLIDFRLPIGDGLIAMSYVMRNSRNSAIAKIMITGDRTRETILSALRAGCHDFLTKEELDAVALQKAMFHALALAKHQKQQAGRFTPDENPARDRLINAIHAPATLDGRAAYSPANPGRETTSKFEASDLEVLLSSLGEGDGHLIH
ncbi:MAG: response regulator [Pseudomonadota bacterium]